MTDMFACKVIYGSFRMIPYGVNGRYRFVWECNPNLNMSFAEQVSHNKMVDPDFQLVRIGPILIKEFERRELCTKI